MNQGKITGKHHIFNKAAAIVTIIAATTLAACSDDAEQPEAGKTVAQATLVHVESKAIASHYVTSGTVTSDHQVSISSRLSGYIRNMNVREGDQVKAGQILVRVDPVDAKQALIQAEADLADAEADLNRYKELLKEGAVSTQQVSKVELRYTVAKSQVEQARNQLSYAEVRSPVAGVIVEKRLSQGDLAAPGMPILTIEDPASLLVETYVSERFVRFVHEGDNVNIEIPSLNQTFTGVVRQVVQAADPVSHQFLVKTALPASENIHPGMYAETGFAVGTRPAVMLPKTAIINRAGLSAVYVVDQSDTAQYRLIRTGQTHNNTVEVLAGLKGGERVAFNGKPELKSGMTIKAVNE